MNRAQLAIARHPKNGGLVEIICKFTDRLKKCAFDSKENPKHMLFLFSCYVLSTLSQYYVEIPDRLKSALENQKREMTAQLNALDLREKRAIQGYHLHILYHLAIQRQSPSTRFIEAFEHYFSYKAFSSGSQNINHLGHHQLSLETFCTRYVYSFASFFETLEHNQREVLKLTESILAASKLSDMVGKNERSPNEVCLNMGVLTFNDSEENAIEINCFEGTVTINRQPVVFNDEYGLPSDIFMELFSDQTKSSLCEQFFIKTVRSPNREYPEIFLFHPGGIFRLTHQPNSEIDKQITFQPKGQSKWWIYCLAATLKTVPTPFQTEYKHFYDPEEDSWRFFKGENYEAFNQALVLKNGANKIEASDKTYHYQSIHFPELERIERKGYFYKKGFKDSEAPYHIEVPRYRLIFIVEQNRVKWKQDPTYFIVKNTLPKGSLSVQNQSLLLANESGDLLLLVPSFSLSAKEGFTQTAELDLFESETIEANEEQETYNCYNVLIKKGEVILKPQTLRARLYLAYYHLRDRHFKESQQLLQSISPVDAFGWEEFWILEKIINYGNKEKHMSPEVYACILKGGLLFYKKKKQEHPNFDLSENLSNILIKRCRSYLATRTHVDRILRLTRSEEALCDKMLKGSLFELHLMRLHFDLEAVISTPRIEPFHVCDSSILTADLDIRQSLPWNASQKQKNGAEALLKFSSVYEAIRLKKEHLNTIEIYLHIQRLMNQNDERLDIHLLYRCLAAKRKGMRLPSIPFLLPQRDQKDSIDAFKKELNNRLKGVSYVLKTPKKIPKTSLRKIVIPKKTHPSYLYYPADFSEEIHPFSLFQQLGLPKDLSSHERQTVRSLPLSKDRVPSLYEMCIEEERKRLNKSIKEGGKNRIKRTAQMGLGKRWKESLSESVLKEQLETCKKKEKKAKEALLKTVNDRLKQGPLTIEQIKARSGAISPLSIESIEDAALWGVEHPNHLDPFKNCAPFREKDFQKIVWEKLLAYEQQAVQVIAYQNALTLYHKIDRASDLSEKDILYAAFADVLDINFRHFAEQTELSILETLIFIRRRGLFPREDQLQDIHSLLEAPCILQKIMGGGKTSIIAAIWAFKTARSTDILPTLFADRSLYQSLVDDIKEVQYTTFKQHVFILPPLSPNFSMEMIDAILDRLREGLRQKQLLVMKGETLRVLDLYLQKIALESNGAEKEKREKLRDILNFFKKHVSAIGDEIDLLLRSDFEVNIPKGQKHALVDCRTHLIRNIWTLLSLNPSLGLQEGTQAVCSVETFKKIVFDLGNDLIQITPSLCLKDRDLELKEAFCQFLINDPSSPIPPKLKAYVEILRQSTDREQREASELIPLARHIIADMLPSLFQQLPGLHFGRSNRGNKEAGKVVPFLGMNTPSTLEIGDHNEAACKHFFTAAIKGIELDQLKVLIDPLIASAKHHTLIRKGSWQQTPAAKAFQVLTEQDTVDLETVYKKPEALNQVLEKINQNPRLRLKIEEKTVSQVVRYHSEYFHSSAQSLANLVFELRGITGTPWNADGYHETLGKVIFDLGAEGEVLDTLLEREPSTFLYELKESSLPALLGALTKGPDVILDMGAFFKEGSIEEAARRFLSLVQSKNMQKKGVLFFHKKEGEQTCDRLALGHFVLNPNTNERTWTVSLLESSRKESLKKEGLVPEDCLAFFDQRHTTGTDLPLPLQAHGVVTISETLDMRTFLQTIMRLRQFCSSQTLDFAFLSHFYTFLKGDKSALALGDVLDYALRQEAIKRATSTFHSFKQKIDELFIETFRTYLREGDISETIKTPYRPFLIRAVADAPYTQFFIQNHLEDPLKVLQEYGINRLKLFEELSSNQLKKEILMLEGGIKKNLKQATEKKKRLPTQVSRKPPSYCIELEMEAEAETEKEIEFKIECKKDLSQELHIYQKSPEEDKRAEHEQWWDETDPKGSVASFIEAIQHRNRSHPSRILSAPEILKQGSYARGRKFEDLFPDTILMTGAMERSYAERLSIFHPSQKKVKDLLIVKDDQDTYFFVILSNHECDFLFNWMKDPAFNAPAWLVTLEGIVLNGPFSTSDSILKEQKVCEGLVLCHLFAGKGSPIYRIPGGLIHFQMWLRGNRGSKRDRKEYLLLHDANLRSLDQFDPLIEQAELKKERRSPDEIQRLTDPELLFSLEREELPFITPSQVPHIHYQWISTLTAPECIQNVPPNRLCDLKEEQYRYLTKPQIFRAPNPTFISKLPKEAIVQLTVEDLKTQEAHSFIRHLSENQLKWLKTLTVEEWRSFDPSLKRHLSPLLKKKEIESLDPSELSFLKNSMLLHISKMQIGQLKEEDISRLPIQKINQLRSSQLYFLTKGQIRGADAHLIGRLPVEKVHLLKDVQLQYLKTKDQLKAIPRAKAILWLRRWQFFEMTLSQKVLYALSWIASF